MMTDGSVQSEAETAVRSRRNRGRLARRVALVLAVALGGAVLMLDGCRRWVEAHTFIWPTRDTPAAPAGVDEVWIDRDDGARLHAWWIPARNHAASGPAPTVLHVHGNAGNIGDHIAFTEWLADDGFNVLLFDYRGYGRSDDGGSRPARAELIDDANAALDAVLARGDVDPSRVGVFGISLGGAVAFAGLGEREEVCAYAAAAPFSTWRGVASDHAGVVGRWLIPSGPEPVDGMSRLGDRPALIVHGTLDTIVPARHLGVFKRAADEAGADLATESIDGAGHNDLMIDFPEARERIAAFFREHLAGE